MNSEREIPTETQIFDAERKRTQGRVIEAAKEMKPTTEVSLSNFPSFPQDEKQRILMGSRVHVISEISSAKRSITAPDVARHLAKARKAIMNVYRNPDVQGELSNIVEDTQGNPYEFETEIARDEVSFTLVLAALTGNTELVDEAIKKMDRAIGKSEIEIARTLAIFERARETFRSHPSKKKFDFLKHSFDESIESSKKQGNWERVATVASWYMIDSAKTGHFSEAFRGTKIAAKAGFNDHATITIPIRQTVQALTNGIRHLVWRATIPSNSGYSSLQLPE